MDKIQKVLVKLGHRDLAQEYFEKIAVDKSRQLFNEIKKFIDSEGKKNIAWQKKEFKGTKIKVDDPFADVKVYHKKKLSHGVAPVYLTYDGAGYDYFSTYGDFGLHRKYREELRKIAKRYGYYFEDENNWSMSFHEE